MNLICYATLRVNEKFLAQSYSKVTTQTDTGGRQSLLILYLRTVNSTFYRFREVKLFLIGDVKYLYVAILVIYQCLL